MTLALAGPQPLDQVARVATDQVKRAMEVVPGVGSVTLSGDPTHEIWVKADLNALKARGLGLSSLQIALQNAQVQAPAGTLSSDGKTAAVVLDALVADPQQLKRIVNQTAGGGLPERRGFVPHSAHERSGKAASKVAAQAGSTAA